jgi:hypothetical protein
MGRVSGKFIAAESNGCAIKVPVLTHLPLLAPAALLQVALL